MRNSKAKSKKNLAVPGEPMSQEEFAALIKEAEKGPFKPIGDLVEDVKLQWKKNLKTEEKKQQVAPDESFSKEEFIALVKEADKGPFKPLGSYEEFKGEILKEWKKRHGK